MMSKFIYSFEIVLKKYCNVDEVIVLAKSTGRTDFSNFLSVKAEKTEKYIYEFQ